jgi:hypothetical protein
MASTVEEILGAIAPQFASSPALPVFKELAELRTSAEFFESKYNLAVALRIAHNMTLASPTSGRGLGEAGPVTSKSEGDLSLSFGGSGSKTQDADADLAQTHFGLQLISLRRGCKPFFGVTGRPGITPAINLGDPNGY